MWRRQRPVVHVLLFILGGFSIHIFLLYSDKYKQATTSVIPYAADYLRSDSIEDVKNSTLGFQKIFVINMAERHDKKDGFAMTASVSNMSFEWALGVNGSNIIDKAKPAKMSEELAQSGANLGCWRAHMNVMQTIVKEQIQTALVFEDDTDWDVNLRSQLLELARGARFIQNEQEKRTLPYGPYGDDWDLLWLGHIGLCTIDNVSQRIWIIKDDPTAVPPQLYGWNRRPTLTIPQQNATSNYTRLVFTPGRGLGAQSYAVSLRGARRLLERETMRGEDASVTDRALDHLCRGFPDVRCIGIYPGVIGLHRAQGPTAKDSDRENRGGEWRKVGVTPHIVFSTRLNMDAVINSTRIGGQGDRIIKSQWPNETLIENYIGDLKIPEGRGLFLS